MITVGFLLKKDLCFCGLLEVICPTENDSWFPRIDNTNFQNIAL
jgi:hypothetical protein